MKRALTDIASVYTGVAGIIIDELLVKEIKLKMLGEVFTLNLCIYLYA